MDQRDIQPTYYVYKQINKETGEYYIGKGTASKCSPEEHRYAGSGCLFLNKYRANKDAFEKTILATFDTEEEAYLYEAKMVGQRYKGGENYDGLCLNLVEGGLHSFSSKRVSSLWEQEDSPFRTEEYTQTLREKAMERNRKVKLQKNNQQIDMDREKLNTFLLDGWEFTTNSVHIWKDDKRMVAYKHLAKHLILEDGWTFGKRKELDKIYTSEAFNRKVATVKLISPSGKEEKIPSIIVPALLSEGWSFPEKLVNIKINYKGAWCQVTKNRGVDLLLNNQGLINYGRVSSYRKVGIKEFLELLP